MAPNAKKPIEYLKVATCVKDRSGKVLEQDEGSLQLCGDMHGLICRKGCMQLYNSSEEYLALDEGVQLLKNKRLNEKPVDMVIVNDGETMITLVYSLEEKQQRQIQFLSGYGLSPREMEIMRLIIQGASNSVICRELFIAHATLRTHLGNIYRKLPPKVRKDFRKSR